MPQLQLKSSVTTATRNKLGQYVKGVNTGIEKATLEAMDETSDDVIKTMQKYPKKLPKQKYVRTFTLKNSWKKSKSAAATRKGFVITNDATLKGRKYARYVVGDAKGNWQNQKYHKGRWKLFKDVLEKAVLKLKKRINEKIKIFIDRTRKI